MKQGLVKLAFFTGVTMAAFWADPFQVWAQPSEIRISKGQTLYVPVYSNVFTGPRKLPYQLASTLSIRNTDMAAPLRITSIDYYDTNGKLVRRHLERPAIVAPLATLYIHIEEKDTTGGFGANFIVRWQSGSDMNAPIIECVMIGATGGQGISFVSPGQVIRE
jgi:hypothetical protein